MGGIGVRVPPKEKIAPPGPYGPDGAGNFGFCDCERSPSKGVAFLSGKIQVSSSVSMTPPPTTRPSA